MANSDDIDELLDENWNVMDIMRASQQKANQSRNKKQNEMIEEISKNMEKIIQEQEQEARKEQAERDRRKKEKDKIFRESSRNIKKTIQKQEKEIKKQEKEDRKKKEQAKEYSNINHSSSTKNFKKKRKIYKNGIIKINQIKYPRLTEPKKRNILQRLALQRKYKNGSFDYIEEDYKKGKINKNDMYISNGSRRNTQNEYYKTIQKYEDALYDVSIRKGWRNFKIGLGTAAIIAITITSANTVSKATDEMSKVIETIFMEIEETDENNSEVSEKKKKNAESILQEIKEDIGLEITGFTLDEQIEAVIKIRETEKKLTLSKAKNYFYSSKDQELLDEIVKSIYEENEDENEAENETENEIENAYESLSDQQKYELRKLAYELLTDEEIKEYFRDPQVVKETNDKQQQKLVEDEEIEK